MDPKKQELNPELKQIYERVMNTQVKVPVPPQSPQSTSTPSPPQTPQTPAANQEPLSSIPTKAGLDDKSFVFTGNKVTTPQEPHTSQSQMQTAPAKKISGPVIAVLVVILIVMWALFWAKFFGLI